MSLVDTFKGETIRASVKEILPNAYMGRANLQVRIEDGSQLEFIGENAFQYCFELEIRMPFEVARRLFKTREDATRVFGMPKKCLVLYNAPNVHNVVRMNLERQRSLRSPGSLRVLESQRELVKWETQLAPFIKRVERRGKRTLQLRY